MEKPLFPVKYLFQAYNILESSGYDSFRKFVNEIGMPTEDIERVLNKRSYNENPEFKKEIDGFKEIIRKRINIKL